MNTHALTTRLLALCLVAGSSWAQAQSATDGPEIERVGQLVEAQCPQFASSLTNRPEIAPILGPHPVDVAKVCGCTGKSFVADKRLRAALNVDDTLLVERLKTEPLRSYMTMRLMSSVLACLAPELDLSLQAAAPSK